MLSPEIKSQLQSHFTKLSATVELCAYLDTSAASLELRELLHELVELSPMITLTEGKDSGRTPRFTLARHGEQPRITFAGIPMGHEFTSLILALLHTGGHPPKASAEVQNQIRGLTQRQHFETYVSLSCQSCPEVVQALNLMAALNPLISHTMIDGALFPDEVEKRQVLAVPNTFVDDIAFSQGRSSMSELLMKLGQASPSALPEPSRVKPMFDVLVIGGGPAGAAAAIYAARKGIRTGIVAERFGGQLLDTLGIENFISVTQTQGTQMVHALEEHVRSYDVDILTADKAQAITTGDVHTVHLSSGTTLKAKSLIIATGARWRDINVPGEQEYKNKGVAYCAHCDGPLFKNKPVAVIGGGNSGVEAAIDLAGLASHVTLLEYDQTLRADEVLQDRLNSLTNVSVITRAQTTQVIGDGARVTGLQYRDRQSDQLHHLDLSGVFVQIGLVPNTDWLKGVVALSPRGEIEVNAHGQSSHPGVFAAGDCTNTPYKQIIIAMGDGAKASLSAFEYLIRQPVSAAA